MLYYTQKLRKGVMKMAINISHPHVISAKVVFDMILSVDMKDTMDELTDWAAHHLVKHEYTQAAIIDKDTGYTVVVITRD